MRSRSFVYGDHRFELDRGVFDPVHHLSGIAFADQLADLAADVGEDAVTALDLGTGCGLLAGTLAQLGLRVVATDVSKSAVRCATRNCRELDVDVRHGDMFHPVEGERFDLVVANPPYERTRPSWFRGVALTSPDFLERFGARVHEFASTAVLGFPVTGADQLSATGLDLIEWRTVETSGETLGLYVSAEAPTGT